MSMTEKKGKAKSESASKRYIAIVGINWRDERVEPGEDVPESVVKRAPWLLDQGCAQAVGEE